LIEINSIKSPKEIGATSGLVSRLLSSLLSSRMFDAVSGVPPLISVSVETVPSSNSSLIVQLEALSSRSEARLMVLAPHPSGTDFQSQTPPAPIVHADSKFDEIPATYGQSIVLSFHSTSLVPQLGSMNTRSEERSFGHKHLMSTRASIDRCVVPFLSKLKMLQSSNRMPTSTL
jgi:hypothetical protein